MIECMIIHDRGDAYAMTLPGKFLRASGLLVEEVEDASLDETHLADVEANCLLEYDNEERTITIQLPEPPAEKPFPSKRPESLSAGEKAVLSEAE
jgi:hypothetical protein